MIEKSELEKLNNNKLLIAKIQDKYNFARTRNKITYTDFLNISEINIAKRFLAENKIKNYIFYGVKKEADRQILIFYSEKFDIEMVEKNYDKILEVIKIKLPNNIKYEHKEFLSGLMKLGIKREKFGDILVTDYGADIVTLAEVSDYLITGLKDLTRFKKSEISIKNIKELEERKVEFEDINIIVSSIRLDNFVSEIVRCSRSIANELIENGRVFINSINELKSSKKLSINDIITIRGKGKFIFCNIEKETRSGKILVNIKKYK